jgi:hypothetical protein
MQNDSPASNPPKPRQNHQQFRLSHTVLSAKTKRRWMAKGYLCWRPHRSRCGDQPTTQTQNTARELTQLRGSLAITTCTFDWKQKRTEDAGQRPLSSALRRRRRKCRCSVLGGGGRAARAAARAAGCSAAGRPSRSCRKITVNTLTSDHKMFRGAIYTTEAACKIETAWCPCMMCSAAHG